MRGVKVGWYVEITYKDIKDSECHAYCHPSRKDDMIRELRENPHHRFFPLREVTKIEYAKYDTSGNKIECQQNSPI